MEGIIIMNTCAPVSVIIPCYNSAETIKRAVDSVFHQTWLPAEVIIVDDCSPDNGITHQCLENLKLTYPSIKLVLLTQNGGPGNARNKGWDMATQDYIAFLDSDDSWHPQKIEIQLKTMLENEDVDISGHDSCVIEENEPRTQLENREDNVCFGVLKRERFLLSNRYATSSVVLKRELNFRFLSNKKYSEDFLLWLSIVLSNKKAIKINRVLLFAYKQPFGVTGLSSQLWNMERGELETYKIIGSRFNINTFYLSLIKVYSFIKFTRRLLVTFALQKGNRSE
jgi:glycosyltransferase involved in cell wall biosynthesis